MFITDGETQDMEECAISGGGDRNWTSGHISCAVRTGYILYEEYGDPEPESQNAPEADRFFQLPRGLGKYDDAAVYLELGLCDHNHVLSARGDGGSCRLWICLLRF